MKIIIDILDEVKEAFDNANIADVDCYVNDYDLLLGKAIKNCIPLATILDELRAEIESQREEISKKHSENDELQAFYNGLNDGLKDARDIIDEYKSESEETL